MPPSGSPRISATTVGVASNRVQLYHLGLWFNSADDAAKANCPSTTPRSTGNITPASRSSIRQISRIPRVLCSTSNNGISRRRRVRASSCYKIAQTSQPGRGTGRPPPRAAAGLNIRRPRCPVASCRRRPSTRRFREKYSAPSPRHRKSRPCGRALRAAGAYRA
jgi:hypothetical protein